ncbi:MAG TPA: hypothetical protein VFU49_15560 [Ktedonobacteraceae bacterium]|nr:hypothetical protein [Ktedonobacteraceae bacterium]
MTKKMRVFRDGIVPYRRSVLNEGKHPEVGQARGPLPSQPAAPCPYQRPPKLHPATQKTKRIPLKWTEAVGVRGWAERRGGLALALMEMFLICWRILIKKNSPLEARSVPV